MPPRAGFLSVLALVAALLSARPASAAVESTATVQALEALYDLDYSRALDLIGSQAQAAPQDPFYRLFEAGVIEWWSSSEPSLLRSSAPLAARFEADVAAAEGLSAPRFDDPDPRARADALFAAGLAAGLEAQADLDARRWIKAYLAGRRGRKLLARCLEADPGYYDADLGIGIYDYLTAHLPGVLKLGALLFVRGDAAGGLARLRLAAEKGRYRFAATQAASNLVSIDVLYEHDYAGALTALRPLREAYPLSPYFRFAEAVALYKEGRWEESRQRALELWEFGTDDPAAFERKRLGILCGLAAGACLSRPALTGAVDWLARALDDPTPVPDGWRRECRLMRAAAYDLLKRRAEALSDFALVKEDPAATAEERAFAERCLKRACGVPDVLAYLKGGP